MIEGYLQSRAGLRAVVLLVDVRRGVEEEERQLIEFLREPRSVSDKRPLAVLLVATKIDKVGLAGRKLALQEVRKLAGAPVIGFSAVTGEGRDVVWERIRSAVL